jgi:hypothetical protein
MISPNLKSVPTAVAAEQIGTRIAFGVAVVICCHNREILLPQRLRHLKAKESMSNCDGNLRQSALNDAHAIA